MKIGEKFHYFCCNLGVEGIQSKFRKAKCGAIVIYLKNHNNTILQFLLPTTIIFV